MDFTGSRDCGDEWGRESAAHSLHLAKRFFKSSRHFGSGHIAGREYKLAHGILFKSALFNKVVADSLVGGEQDPAVLSDERQPDFIGSAALKVNEVTLEANFEFRKDFEDGGRVTEILVQV
jgi:hypothetical protein